MPKLFNKRQIQQMIKEGGSSLDLTLYRASMPNSEAKTESFKIFEECKDTHNNSKLAVLNHNTLAVIHYSDIAETWDISRRERVKKFSKALILDQKLPQNAAQPEEKIKSQASPISAAKIDSTEKGFLDSAKQTAVAGACGIGFLIAIPFAVLASPVIFRNKYIALNWIFHKRDKKALVFSNNRVVSNHSGYLLNVFTFNEHHHEIEAPSVHLIPLSRESKDEMYDIAQWNDRTIAVCDLDGYIWFGDLSAEKANTKWRPDGNPIYAVSKVADNLLASASYNDVVYLHDPRQVSHVAKLQGHTQRVVDLAAFANTQQLASASYDGTTLIWDIRERKALKAIPTHPDKREVFLAALPDGRLAVNNQTLKVYDFNNEEKLPIQLERGGDSHDNYILALPDGQLASIDRSAVSLLPTTGKLCLLQWEDVIEIFTPEFTQQIAELNLQNSDLSDRDIKSLANKLCQQNVLVLDIRNTKITEAGLIELYKTLIAANKFVKIIHERAIPEVLPVYRMEFCYSEALLARRPDDKVANEKLSSVIKASHEIIFLQFKRVLSNPEELTNGLIKKMFQEVCCIVDFKFVFTLFNIKVAEKETEYNELKPALLDCLEWLSHHAMFNAHDVAQFKHILRYLVTKNIITLTQADVLESDAQSTKTFLDKRFLVVKLDVNVLKDKMDETKKEIQVVREDVQYLRTNLEELKRALLNKANRGIWIAIAKVAIPFVAQGLVSAFENVCDLSSFYELGASIFNRTGISPADFSKIVLKGKDALAGLLSDQASKLLGTDKEVFIDCWYEISTQLQSRTIVTPLLEDKKPSILLVAPEPIIVTTLSVPNNSAMQSNTDTATAYNADPSVIKPLTSSAKLLTQLPTSFFAAKVEHYEIKVRLAKINGWLAHDVKLESTTVVEQFNQILALIKVNNTCSQLILDIKLKVEIIVEKAYLELLNSAVLKNDVVNIRHILFHIKAIYIFFKLEKSPKVVQAIEGAQRYNEQYDELQGTSIPRVDRPSSTLTA